MLSRKVRSDRIPGSLGDNLGGSGYCSNIAILVLKLKHKQHAKNLKADALIRGRGALDEDVTQAEKAVTK